MRPLGEHLGVDEVIATRAEVDERRRLHRRARLLRLRALQGGGDPRPLAAARGHRPRASYAYSDSITDEPMLRVVGHPVAVNPDRELAKLAQAEGWEIRNFAKPVRLRDRMSGREPALAASGALAAAGAGVAVWWWLAAPGARRAPDAAASRECGSPTSRPRSRRCRGSPTRSAAPPLS